MQDSLTLNFLTPFPLVFISTRLTHPPIPSLLLLLPPFLLAGAELQSVPLLARSPSTNRKYPPLPVDKLEEEMNRRMADDNKLFREEFNVWHKSSHNILSLKFSINPRPCPIHRSRIDFSCQGIHRKILDLKKKKKYRNYYLIKNTCILHVLRVVVFFFFLKVTEESNA